MKEMKREMMRKRVGDKEGAKGGNLEIEDGEGEKWREKCLIIQHYPCSLFMALLEEPVETIYTHTVGTGCSLK